MDREKVIEGLEVCRDQDNPPGYRFTTCVDDCPYHGNGCARKLKEDALELLKELDPVETELEGGGYNWWHVCGDCHGAIDQNDNYCKHCGRRIKHEKKAE